MTFGEVLWLLFGAFAGVVAAFGALGLVEVVRIYGGRRGRLRRETPDFSRDH